MINAHAQDIGLKVNAGHGLDYENVGPLASMPGVKELNIGFAIIARAVLVGVEQAVQEMLLLLTPAPTTNAVAESLPGARN